MRRIIIKDLRIVVSDKCPYRCIYCNLYFKDLLKQGVISKEKFNQYCNIGNESHGLLSDDNKNKEFSLEDYDFLFSILKERFFLEDVTFTGGDPFLNPQIKEIINLADKKKLRTTIITKGAPLFNIKNKKDAFNILGNVSRIIFSIDTLDPEKYADTTLPFTKKTEALSYLPKTLKIIKKLSKLGYNIEVNTVIDNCFFRNKKMLKKFHETKEIIQFCLDSNINKVKFIELESKETLGKPYIEKYFQEMIKMGFFAKYSVLPDNVNYNIKPNNITEIYSIPVADLSKNLKVLAYRTHCPASFLNKDEKKKCEFSSGGELHLDLYGRSFLCQKDPNLKFVDLIEVVKEKNINGFVEKILLIDKKIKKQKCKF